MAVISLKLKTKSRSLLAGNAFYNPIPVDYLVVAGGAGGGTFGGGGRFGRIFRGAHECAFAAPGLHAADGGAVHRRARLQ